MGLFLFHFMPTIYDSMLYPCLEKNVALHIPAFSVVDISSRYGLRIFSVVGGNGQLLLYAFSSSCTASARPYRSSVGQLTGRALPFYIVLDEIMF